MSTDTYTASDGSLWHIEHVYRPIPHRDYDWQAVHDSYEPGDERGFHARTRDEVLAQVDQWVEENA